MAATEPTHVADDGPATTGRTGRVAALTGLRGLAALVVLVLHVSGRTEYPWLGVSAFGPVCLFVLSGYLLYRPWASWLLGVGGRPSLPAYARHRLLRIFPLYWVVLLVVAVVLPASRPPDPGHWLRALALLQTTHPAGLRPGLEQVWSLGTELAWYVVLPVVSLLLGAVLRDRSRRTRVLAQVTVLASAAVLTAGWRVWSDVTGREASFTVSFWFPAFAVAFAAGASVALVEVCVRSGIVRADGLLALARDQGACLAVAAAAVLVTTSSLSGPDGYLPATSWERQVRLVCALVLSLALLVPSVLGGEGVATRLLSPRWLVATGRWSFGVYLWHLPVVVLLVEWVPFPGGPAGLAWLLGTTLAVSLPLSAVTYRWVELPAIRFARRAPALARSSATTTPSSPAPAPATSGSTSVTGV